MVVKPSCSFLSQMDFSEGNKTFGSRVTFINPNVANSVRIVKPRSKRGFFVCRILPTRDWTVLPEESLEPIVRVDPVRGVLTPGFWMFGMNVVENFGPDLMNSVTIAVGEPGKPKATYGNPYNEVYYGLLKDRYPVESFPTWKALIASEKKDGFRGVFTSPTHAFFFPVAIYRDTTVQEPQWIGKNETPLGLGPNDQMQILQVSDKTGQSIIKMLQVTDEMGERAYKDFYSPNAGLLLYMLSNEVNPFTGEMVDWRQSFTVDLYAGKKTVGDFEKWNLSLSPEQQKMLIDRALPWASGRNPDGTMYDGIINAQSSYDVFKLMVEQFPAGEEVYRYFLKDKPELFTEEIERMFAMQPDNLRHGVDYVKIVSGLPCNKKNASSRIDNTYAGRPTHSQFTREAPPRPEQPVYQPQDVYKNTDVSSNRDDKQFEWRPEAEPDTPW